MKKEEKILREYIEFADIYGSETVDILPLTIVDIMQEYSELQNKELVDRLAEKDKEIEKVKKEYFIMGAESQKEERDRAYEERGEMVAELQSELSELKEKHKGDVETAFSEGLFLPHDSDLTAEQYYNETHKTK